MKREIISGIVPLIFGEESGDSHVAFFSIVVGCNKACPEHPRTEAIT